MFGWITTLMLLGSGIKNIYAIDIRAIDKHTEEFKWIRDMEKSFMTKHSSE